MTEYLKKFLKDEPVYMTQEEGMSLAEMGLIQPNVAQVSPINPNAVLVNLTEAGQKRLDQMMKPELPLPPVQPNAPVEVEQPPVAVQPPEIQMDQNQIHQMQQDLQAASNVVWNRVGVKKMKRKIALVKQYQERWTMKRSCVAF